MTAKRDANAPSLVSFKYWNLLIVSCPTQETIPAFKEHLKSYNCVSLIRLCQETYSANLLQDIGVQVYDWFFPDGANPPKWIENQWFDLLESLRPDIFNKKQYEKEQKQKQQQMMPASPQQNQIFQQVSGSAQTMQYQRISSSPTPPMQEQSMTPPLQLSPQLMNQDGTQRRSSSMQKKNPDFNVSLPTIALHCISGLGRAPMLVALALVQYGTNSLEAIQIVRKARRGALNNEQARYVAEFKPQKRKNKPEG